MSTSDRHFHKIVSRQAPRSKTAAIVLPAARSSLSGRLFLTGILTAAAMAAVLLLPAFSPAGQAMAGDDCQHSGAKSKVKNYTASAASAASATHGAKAFGDLSALDASGDGLIDLAEFQKQFPGATAESFVMVDTDKSGGVDAKEWGVFLAAHGKGHGKKGDLKDKGAHAKKGDGYGHGGAMDLKKYMIHMGDMDQDGDDEISWPEFQAHFKETDRSVFDAVDADKNDSVDHDEWHTFKEAHGQMGEGH